MKLLCRQGDLLIFGDLEALMESYSSRNLCFTETGVILRDEPSGRGHVLEGTARMTRPLRIQLPELPESRPGRFVEAPDGLEISHQEHPSYRNPTPGIYLLMQQRTLDLKGLLRASSRTRGVKD